MYIKHLKIANYKNLKNVEIAPSKGLNFIIGNNGMGKTNLLDSIYYIAMCKSSLGTKDKQNINTDETFFRIDAKVDTLEYDILLTASQESKLGNKVLRKNGKKYSKITSHIGEIPVVIISPQDHHIISEVEERRRFLNNILSQIDSPYLADLIAYNLSLQNRNALLKSGSRDMLLYELYNESLAKYGSRIAEKREVLIQKISPRLEEYITLFSNNLESLKIEYKSQYTQQDSLFSALSSGIERDLLLGYTQVGPHRDRVSITLNGLSIRKLSSQGQQKSVLIALKMAQFIIMKEHLGKSPILLLDDILDRLDSERAKVLIDLISSSTFNQVFITESHSVKVDLLLKSISDNRIDGFLNHPYRVFKVVCGEVL